MPNSKHAHSIVRSFQRKFWNRGQRDGASGQFNPPAADDKYRDWYDAGHAHGVAGGSFRYFLIQGGAS